MSETHPSQPPAPPLPRIDVRERGGRKDGVPQFLDQRLFVQLLVFRVADGFDVDATADSLRGRFRGDPVTGVVYADANDPRGLGLVTWSVDPEWFVSGARAAVNSLGGGLSLRPEMAMFGRTYSSGYEQDLHYWLIARPPENITRADSPWAVWYPLRRKGPFNQLEPREAATILREHAQIGRAYGEADLAHDVRLACHGLDANDNEFVIGLIGKDLHPLSHVVQTMRKTTQTAQHIEQMGPFFVGRRID